MAIQNVPIRRHIALASIILFAFDVPSLGQRPSARHYSALTFPSLHDFVIPDVQEVTLDSGMRLYLLEDHKSPLIHVAACIRLDPSQEPEDKLGVAGITIEVMRTGGTTTRTGDQIDSLLDQIGASRELSMDLNTCHVTALMLSDDQRAVIEILADTLMHPAFGPDRVELAKMQCRSGIARRNDSSVAVASREFKKLIYGPTSVYARKMEYVTLDRITRDDLVDFHKRFFGPNNMVLSVWGDFSSDQMVETITDAFAGWRRVVRPQTPLPEVDHECSCPVHVIDMPAATQSTILVGHIGGIKSDPDYVPLTVMNEILGGVYTGRLFRRIRSREGLAYSIVARYSSNFDHPGMFYAMCQTKSRNTPKTIGMMLEEIKAMTVSLVTKDELALAKESFLNSFVFEFSESNRILQRLMTYGYYGYPLDFLDRMKTGVEAVTRADVLQAARKHLHPDRVRILVVGRQEDFGDSLSAFGKVAVTDLAALDSRPGAARRDSTGSRGQGP